MQENLNGMVKVCNNFSDSEGRGAQGFSTPKAEFPLLGFLEAHTHVCLAKSNKSQEVNYLSPFLANSKFLSNIFLQVCYLTGCVLYYNNNHLKNFKFQ